MCVVLKCAIVAVARQRVRIWLQSYEKNIKPVPFSVGIDVFFVPLQPDTHTPASYSKMAQLRTTHIH